MYTGMKKKGKLSWKVHTPRLLEEILCNPEVRCLHIPVSIFVRLLARVAQRAAELNDPEMDRLMVKLAMYSVSDPYHEDYDPGVVHELLYGDKED